MGNRLLSSRAAHDSGASNEPLEQAKGTISEPTFNNLMELLDSLVGKDLRSPRWLWLDENGRETLSCTPRQMCDRHLFAYFYSATNFLNFTRNR